MPHEETRPGNQPFGSTPRNLPSNRRWEKPHLLLAIRTKQTEKVAPPTQGKTSMRNNWQQKHYLHWRKPTTAATRSSETTGKTSDGQATRGPPPIWENPRRKKTEHQKAEHQKTQTNRITALTIQAKKKMTQATLYKEDHTQ